VPDLTREDVSRMFAAFAAKDLVATLAFFADDAEFYDPNYPTPRMVGKAAIARGLTWAYEKLERPDFTIRHTWLDGASGAVEVEARHRIRGGLRVAFPQAFVFETRDGLLTRLQAYTPNGPHGAHGVFLVSTRLARLVRLARRPRRAPGRDGRDRHGRAS